ncbi:hypothetical protein NIES3275_50740 [Microchaete diplosiphon NIES-3275]|nr:hypothetical protein NIES3275_50740 [Microchaete diplosiphon NIES-3275]
MWFSLFNRTLFVHQIISILVLLIDGMIFVSRIRRSRSRRVGAKAQRIDFQFCLEA